MKNNRYQKITPGLSKIQQVFGEKEAPLKDTLDRLKLFKDALHHFAELTEIDLHIVSENTEDDFDTIIERVSTFSGVRIQKINLERNWWAYDIGIILAFMDGFPCVLIPQTNGGYMRSTPSETIPLTKEQLEQISTFGYTATKPLPPEIHSISDLLKFTFQTLKGDLRRVLYLQFFLSLIIASLPMLMSYFFNHFNEFVERSQSLILVIALIVNSLIFFLLSIFQSIVVLHLRFKAQMRLEPAIWDRLLKLSPAFFRQFDSGSIAYRAGVVSSIQEMITQSTLLSIFSIMVSVVSLALMCYYDFHLAMLAFLSFLIITPIFYFISKRALIYQRKGFDTMSKQSGFVYQVLSAILKFKVSANEYRAFNLWSDYFSNLLIARFKAEKIQVSVHILQSSLLFFMTLVLFTIYIYWGSEIPFGSFIAFNAAYSQFFTTLLTLMMFLLTITTIIPLFEQSMVIFKSEMDPIRNSGSHIQLEGKITVKNLSFRYDETQPLIYKNINFTINPGEVIGITGSSGCGKSTLFRLLLGLDNPLDGQIFYDDINMEMINLSNLRQQVGVITQRSVLTSGTLLENILGNNKNLTRKDAWDIVYNLGIEDMINALPMEMETIIQGGLQTLSKGEQQRIILARALIKKPKILFLDEATSALDAQNQAKIQDYLNQLKMTRIIIAHRLSTLKMADRIFVIHNGQIVQDGSFEELIKTKGYFRELANFQLSDDNNKK